MANELFELARRRRSCRRYTGEKIPDEIVDEILKIALLAPSSWGGHPIEFVVVRDKAMIQKIAQCKRMGAGSLSQADVAIVVMANTTNSVPVGFTFAIAPVNVSPLMRKFANCLTFRVIFLS